MTSAAATAAWRPSGRTRRSRNWSTIAEQVLDPMTAYQITSMMEGVVQRGTAVTMSELGRPIAGKTGTTNDEKDAWFVGFSPNLVVGLYHGLRQAAGRSARARPAAASRRRSSRNSWASR